MLASAFYNGLKYEVRCNLVGQWPNKLNELKHMAITLDKEQMATQDPDQQDQQDPKPRPFSCADTPCDKTRDEPSQVTDRGHGEWSWLKVE